MKQLNKKFTLFCLSQICYFNLFCQNPVWPLVNTWDQINCTFAEKHTAFHGAIDINVTNGSRFLAIMNGKVKNNANSSNFFICHHEIQDNTDIESNLKVVRYGDATSNLTGVNNGSNITQSQEIGDITSGGHLHFEMWIRDCVNDCDWYRVNPLDNNQTNYTNLPPNYNDTYEVELNDVIYEAVNLPAGVSSGLIFTEGNGHTDWHYNSLKVHFKDRPDSDGTIYDYDGDAYIGAFGSIISTIHPMDKEVTHGTNSTGEGLGIHESVFYIDNDLKFWLLFDEIEVEKVNRWSSFFNNKFNNAQSTNTDHYKYGNHDYIKMHRMPADVQSWPHKLVGGVNSNGIWFTRAHKSTAKTFGITPNIFSDIPINSLYNDGNYHLNHAVLDAANNRADSHTKITLDNFQPFITDFKVKDGSATRFNLVREQNDPTGVNNGNITLDKPIENYTGNLSDLLTMEITGSVKIIKMVK